MLPYQALERLGLSPADIQDPFLRKFQKCYDEQCFDQYPYALQSKDRPFTDAKVAHIALHVVRAREKLDAALETRHPKTLSAVRNETFPDVLIYRTQIANTYRYNLKRRLVTAVASGTELENARKWVNRAEKPLVALAESLEHRPAEPSQRRDIRSLAIPALHHAGLIMAEHFGVSPSDAHAERLMELIRQRAPEYFS